MTITRDKAKRTTVNFRDPSDLMIDRDRELAVCAVDKGSVASEEMVDITNYLLVWKTRYKRITAIILKGQSKALQERNNLLGLGFHGFGRPSHFDKQTLFVSQRNDRCVDHFGIRTGTTAH